MSTITETKPNHQDMAAFKVIGEILGVTINTATKSMGTAIAIVPLQDPQITQLEQLGIAYTFLTQKQPPFYIRNEMGIPQIHLNYTEPKEFAAAITALQEIKKLRSKTAAAERTT